MIGPAGAMDWDNFQQSLPAFLTIAVMPLTYSIANGVVAGLISYVVLELFTTPTLWRTVIERGQGLLEPLKGSDMNGGGSVSSQLDSSAAASPHAMVRNPLGKSSNSFNGLSALGGTRSPNAMPSPVQLAYYEAPFASTA